MKNSRSQVLVSGSKRIKDSVAVVTSCCQRSEGISQLPTQMLVIFTTQFPQVAMLCSMGIGTTNLSVQ